MLLSFKFPVSHFDITIFGAKIEGVESDLDKRKAFEIESSVCFSLLFGIGSGDEANAHHNSAVVFLSPRSWAPRRRRTAPFCFPRRDVRNELCEPDRQTRARAQCSRLPGDEDV